MGIVMAQAFGILGFIFALLAIFFASEVMRRAAASQAELAQALIKARQRIQRLESRMDSAERLGKTTQHQKKRQAETITAMANKGDKDADGRDHEHFTPSSHKERKTG